MRRSPHARFLDSIGATAADGRPAADTRDAVELSPASHGLFRLRRARPDRRVARHVDQGTVDVECGRSRGPRRLAESALPANALAARPTAMRRSWMSR